METPVAVLPSPLRPLAAPIIAASGFAVGAILYGLSKMTEAQANVAFVQKFGTTMDRAADLLVEAAKNGHVPAPPPPSPPPA